MAKRMTETTPKADGFRMPAEFEPQAGVWMLWPERPDNWRGGGKPAQQRVLRRGPRPSPASSRSRCASSAAQYQNARARLPEHIRVVEMSANDAWVRDCGPTFLVNDAGRAARRGLGLQRLGRPRRRAVLSRGTRTIRSRRRSASSRGRTATARTASCSRAAPSTSTARARCSRQRCACSPAGATPA